MLAGFGLVGVGVGSGSVGGLICDGLIHSEFNVKPALIPR